MNDNFEKLMNKFDIKLDKVNTIEELYNQIPPYVFCKVKKNNYDIRVGSETIRLIKDSSIILPINQFQVNEKINGIRILELKNKKFDDFFRRYRGEDLNNKKLLVWRFGGIGDLIFTQPILKHIKKNYTNVKITYATSKPFIKILESFPDGLIDDIIRIPMYENEIHRNDYHLTFEGVLERCEESKKINCYDLYSKFAGVTIDHNDSFYKPELIIEDKDNYVKNIIPPNYVVLQVKPSSRIREMNVNKWIGVINKLIDKNINIVFIDKSDNSYIYDKFIEEFNLSKNFVFNLSSKMRDLNDALNVINYSLGVIGIDSSFVHIANALNKHSVGIFASFSGDLRMRYYKNSAYIEPKEKQCELQPCFLHQFDSYKCKYYKKPKPCFYGINEDEIVDKFMELTNGTIL